MATLKVNLYDENGNHIETCKHTTDTPDAWIKSLADMAAAGVPANPQAGFLGSPPWTVGEVEVIAGDVWKGYRGALVKGVDGKWAPNISKEKRRVVAAKLSYQQAATSTGEDYSDLIAEADVELAKLESYEAAIVH